MNTQARVVARFLQAAIGDPKDLLAQFEMVIVRAEMPETEIQKARKILTDAAASNSAFWPGLTDAQDYASTAFYRVFRYWRDIADIGHKLFLSIIQSLVLPPALRKKVEVASRAYLKTTKHKFKNYGIQRSLDQLDQYEKAIKTLQAHAAIAKEAVAKGKAHAEEGAGATKLKVGSFTLVNTGGFSEEVMGNIAEVMKKVEALARSSGLGEVCYGEVQITNTINKSRVLAFYLISSDELFIRANVRASVDTVQTVLHELGHRYEHKVLNNSRGIERLYHTLSGQEIRRKFDFDKMKGKAPKPGDEVQDRGKVYRVTKALPDFKAGFKILLEQVDNPRNTAHTTLAGWLSMKGESMRDFDTDPNYIGFVSDYAKKGGPAENFAEMFAYYCMGRLPVLQSVPFEELVFGTGKTAREQTARRVAARWILEG